MRDGVAHAADLAVAPFANRDFEPRARPLPALERPQPAHVSRPSPPAFDRHASPEPVQIPIVGHAFDLDVVGPLQRVARVRDVLGEVAVVGQISNPSESKSRRPTGYR